MTKTTIAVDGDVIAYRAAAATEKRSVEVTHKTEDIVEVFDTLTEFRKWCVEKDYQEEDFEKVACRVAEDKSHTNHILRNTVKQAIASCKADEVEIYISGTDNFRDSIPLPKLYKGNRAGLEKPINLVSAKEFLVKNYNGVVVNGYEADDKLSMRAYDGYIQKEKIIQVTIDKDADQCQGWLFNFLRMDCPQYVGGLGEVYLDTKGKLRGLGTKFLYAQLLMGDSTDGYKPTDLCKAKMADKGAYAVLKDCKTHKECWEAVYKTYLGWYPEPVTYTAWDGVGYTKDAIAIMQMYLDCARMLRWEGDTVCLCLYDNRSLLHHANEYHI